MKSAGSVKMIPLATELDAEPMVWARLASRMLPCPPARSSSLSAATVMTAMGTEVEIVSLDITNEDETATEIARLFADAKPLKGVLHAAAVIKDGFINQLTDQTIDSVLYPKVAGGWALEKAFAKAGKQPEFMIQFSSIAATTGSPGQANYVAANGFLDALAAYRKIHQDEGGSINWGAIAATGVVGRNEEPGGASLRQ